MRVIHDDLKRRFDRVWDGLAHLGWCDARGGVEYTRVLGEWHDAGRVLPCAWFIKLRANVAAVQARGDVEEFRGGD